MSEPENFLSRWSRRKLEAEQEQAAPKSSEQDSSARPRESEDPDSSKKEPAEPAALDSGARGTGPGEGTDENKEPIFDLTKLPSLDSITAETDIRLFLQKGVPAELTRAALRRAWSADPAIRNFREIAENQYDFATGSDLPGFGDLGASADELRKMVADVFGGPKPPVEAAQETAEIPEKPALAEAGAPAKPVDTQEIAAGSEAQEPSEGPSGEPEKDVVRRNKVDTALQQSNTEVEYAALPTRRPHGRALPQ